MERKGNHPIKTWRQWEEEYVKEQKLVTEALADARRFIRTKNLVITYLAISIVFMGLSIGILNNRRNKKVCQRQ